MNFARIFRAPRAEATSPAVPDDEPCAHAAVLVVVHANNSHTLVTTRSSLSRDDALGKALSEVRDRYPNSWPGAHATFTAENADTLLTRDSGSGSQSENPERSGGVEAVGPQSGTRDSAGIAHPGPSL